VALAVMLVAIVAAPDGASASSSGSGSGAKGRPGAHAAASKLAEGGHAVFWECPAKTTELLVAVNTLTLHPGATLHISFAVRNGATTACNYTAPYVGVVPGPTATTLQAGPCGSVGYEIQGPQHANVWPGPKLVNCPALGFAQLAPNATVSGRGSWNQTKPDSTQRVPAGNYTLVVNDNRHFSFPIRVARS
jgi:hypothetical protein